LAPSRFPTPSQTAGPYVAIGTAWNANGLMVPEGTPDALTVTGRIRDGSGEPVTDAMAEFWQADAHGRFPPETSPAWSGFTRALTDESGCYRLLTVKPGRVPTPGGGLQAPHIDMSIFARGLLQRLVTRIYFPDEGAANAADPVLASLSQPLSGRLVARHEAASSAYRFDIWLQGETETVFFAPW